MSAHDELAEREAKVAEAQAKAHRIAADAAAATKAVAQARTALAKAEQDGTPKEVEVAKTALAEAREVAEGEPWPERQKLAAAKVTTAEQEARAWKAANARRLVDESEAEGETAAREANRLLREVAAAITRVNAIDAAINRDAGGQRRPSSPNELGVRHTLENHGFTALTELGRTGANALAEFAS